MQTRVLEQKNHLILIFLILSTVYLAFPNARLDFWWNWNDAAIYITLSYNLIYHKIYSLSLFAPFQQHWLWPPGYPLILTPVIAIFGRSLLAIKLFMVLCSLITLFLIWQLFKDKQNIKSYLETKFIVMYTGLNLHWFIASHQAMAEIPTIGSGVLGLLALRYWALGNFRSYIRLTLAIFSCAFACYIKGYGILLIPTACVYILRMVHLPLRSRIRWIILYTLPCMVLGLSWPIMAWLHPAEGYSGRGQLEMLTRSEKYYREGTNAPRAPLSEIVSRQFTTLKWFGIRWTAQSVFPFLEQVDPTNDLQVWRGIRLLCVCLVMFGWCRTIWHRNAAMDYFYIFFILLSLSIASGGSPRYWVPLIPFSAYYAVEAIKNLLSRKYFLVTICILLSIQIIVFGKGLYSFEKQPYEDHTLKDFVAVLEFSNNAMPPDAIIVSHHTHHAWVMTGREAMGLSPLHPYEDWQSLLLRAEHRPVFVVVRHESNSPIGQGERLLSEDPRVSLKEQYKQGIYTLFKFESFDRAM